ncbi:MAG TPA: GTPase Era [Alphaproteobacteria bacterium]|nr:GTPase Era [Alphaproteobacteria bacterium]
MAEDQPGTSVPTGNSPGERCGFVALLGAPNAGKSTLTNALVGAKISIVTPKVQTTRMRIVGIAVLGSAQLVLVDTPGIFAPRRRLDRAMVAAAWKGARDADVVCLIVDSKRGLDDDTRRIVEGLRGSGTKAVLVLNKIDEVRKPLLLDLAARMNAEGVFTDTFMISALTGDGVADLRAFLAARMPSGPWLYPEDQLSDLPQRLLAAELVREQVFLQLHQELPYGSAVEVESWEEFADGSAKVTAVIYVQREGQRPIVLGRNGSRIKSIGVAARKELELLLGRRVHLMLRVKVQEDWQERPELYRGLGLDFEV